MYLLAQQQDFGSPLQEKDLLMRNASPEIDAFLSCIHSSNADCTFAGARLISSASTKFAKIGPFFTENFFCFRAINLSANNICGRSG